MAKITTEYPWLGHFSDAQAAVYFRAGITDKESAHNFVLTKTLGEMIDAGLTTKSIDILGAACGLPRKWIPRKPQLVTQKTLDKYRSVLEEHGYTVAKP